MRVKKNPKNLSRRPKNPRRTKQMSDLTVAQTYNTSNHKLLPPPSYLVILDEVKKGANYFLSIKVDFEANFIKCIGFYTNATYEAIIKNYADLVKDTISDNVIEVMFPYHKIKTIQSLVYKFKGMK